MLVSSSIVFEKIIFEFGIKWAIIFFCQFAYNAPFMIWKLHTKIGDMINGKYYSHTIFTALDFNKIQFGLYKVKHF